MTITQPGRGTGDQSGEGRITWRSPSNIAIVKYWGKHGEQLPSNPSVSLTLSRAFSETTIQYKEGNGRVDFFFEDKKNEAFEARVRKYVKRIERELPLLENLDLRIHSSNSFPHSAGIASSASAMSALAMCLSSVSASMSGNLHDVADTTTRSHLARLGSGSAARSVAGPVMLWGETQYYKGSSDEYAITVEEIDPVFRTYCDSILIVSSEEKKVGSSAGHALMEGHPYAERRFDIARQRIGQLLEFLKEGDLHAFGNLLEQEALDLHAMMMTSTPPFLLMRPGTVAIIEKLKAFRKATDLPVYMTLDAGPNVHLLYPVHIEDEVRSWIQSQLVQHCAEGKTLHDRVGSGPQLII